MSIKLPKRYQPKQAEPKWQAFWSKENLYKFDKASKKPIYSVDTPPPYASAAHLHVGHAMSYTQAEFIIRFQRMQGYNIFYPMGFDDNGLPTERYVEKKYKIKDKTKITRDKFIELCLKETVKVSKTYTDLWKTLGLSIDWSLLYTTISPLARRIAQKSFIDLHKKNLLEHRKEPTHWCPHCQTALAQADLEDKEKQSKLYYIKFTQVGGLSQTDPQQQSKLTIATTRPELLAACVALYVNPKDKRYKDLVGKEVITPIFNHKVPIKSDDSVDPEYGTGLMMVCTWGDSEDVLKWKKDKLNTRLIIDKKGKLNQLAKPYQNLTINQAREKIIKDLKKQNFLSKQEDLVHTLNIHDRCKTPAEFFQTKQWFIKITDHINEFKKQGQKLKWYPKFMKKKYDTWLDNLEWDWNISRERYYGVPFPVWYCQECNKVILPDKKDLPVDPTEDNPKKLCPKCHSNNLIPEKDVMDTWMTSSLTPQINFHWQEQDENKKIFPMTLRIQAFEIIRTWLFYTIVKSWYHKKSLPWQNVMISGHGLDPQGRKISKSLGNFKPIDKILENFSADALRYWSAGANLGKNLRYKEEEIQDGKKLINKLYNASKFCLMHLQESEIEKPKQFQPIDLWILTKLQKTIKETTKHFQKYEYSKAKKAIYNFFWKNFADNYIELAKHRLYAKKETNIQYLTLPTNKQVSNTSNSKTATRYTLFICLVNILKLFAPIIPHITEELWQAIKQLNHKKTQDLEKSIHISPWPKQENQFIHNKFEKLGDQIIEILSAIRKSKTKAGLSMNKEIKQITIDAKQKNLEKFFPDLAATINAQKIIFGKAERKITPDIKIKVQLK